MYNTILVPIDIPHIQERGNIVLEIARQHSSEDTRIILLNVVEQVPAWVAAEIPSHIMPESVQSAHLQLTALAREAKIKAEVEVRSGHSHRTILEAAEDLDADLIIVGSHKPGLQNYFLGSTADRIVRHASCSVLVVR